MNWYRLYLPSDDVAAIVDAGRAALTAMGYTLYNPFGGLPGVSYRETARLFVAPARGGWTAVIVSPEHPAPVAPALSTIAPCLELAWDGGVTAQLYRAGVPAEDTGTALLPYLRDGKTSVDLRAALTLTLADTPQANTPDLPLDALPDDARALADRVNLKQASSLFNRLSEGLAKRAGKTGDEDEARALLRSSAPDWNSASGRQIQAILNCLTIPGGGRAPDFVALRDAYQLHARRRRSPNADLYPGDAEAMAAVPDALDYTPIYGGRNP